MMGPERPVWHPGRNAPERRHIPIGSLLKSFRYPQSGWQLCGDAVFCYLGSLGEGPGRRDIIWSSVHRFLAVDIEEHSMTYGNYLWEIVWLAPDGLLADPEAAGLAG